MLSHPFRYTRQVCVHQERHPSKAAFERWVKQTAVCRVYFRFDDGRRATVWCDEYGEVLKTTGDIERWRFGILSTADLRHGRVPKVDTWDVFKWRPKAKVTIEMLARPAKEDAQDDQ